MQTWATNIFNSDFARSEKGIGADNVVPAICSMAGSGDNALKNQTLGVLTVEAMLKPMTFPVLPPNHSHSPVSSATNKATTVWPFQMTIKHRKQTWH